MELCESLEDYLEAILVLSGQLKQVRSVDVASYLGYSKPSVSHAVKLLEKQNLITLGESKALELSPEGQRIAQEIYHRHVFFTDMLQNIGVKQEVAEQDACRIEHVLSQETFDAIERFYKEAEEAEGH